MQQQVIGIVVAFFVFFAIGLLLRRAQEPSRRYPVIRRGFWTDAVYWLLTPFTTKLVTRAALIVGILPVAYLIYGKVDRELLVAGFGPASRLSVPVQACLMLLISDFLSYWVHRAFHRQWLWPFHAVHHSSVDLDWLSSVRVHPVNDIVMRVAAVVPLVALGFAPLSLVAVTPILTAMAILIHSNVDWDFGPFRTVIASPRFHRWHHTVETEARDKNFAGFFPVWDILFGTYYMPRDRRPTAFGTTTPVPTGLVGQLTFPFRRSARRHASGATPTVKDHTP
jgi:sterol desaturase/sphingolipid hydroxylase (fatty acid hydroxylase superfamily)